MADNTPTFPSDWNSASTNPEQAWWRSQIGNGTAICTTVGIGALGALQEVLMNGLRPPWKGPDGTSYSTRVRIDGNFGPATAAAMWAYAKLIGAQASILATIAAAYRAKKISLPLMQIALWLAYYQPRHSDIDIGNPAKKTVSTDVAILGVQPLSAISIPANAIPWVWLGRPNAPSNMLQLADWMPGCTTASTPWDFSAPQIDTTPPGTIPAVPDMSGGAPGTPDGTTGGVTAPPGASPPSTTYASSQTPSYTTPDGYTVYTGTVAVPQQAPPKRSMWGVVAVIVTAIAIAASGKKG